MSFLGGLSGGFGGVLGDQLFGGGGDPGKKRLKQIQALYKALNAQQGQLYGKAAIQQKKTIGDINTGYGNALANSGLIATQAKQNAQSAGQQQQGAATQSLVSRGLYNTTAADAAARGINSDTQKNLAGIDAALAQIQGNLHAGQGQALAGAHSALSGFFQNQNAANTGLGLSQIGTLANVQDQNTDWLSQLIGTGAQLAPFFLG